MSDSLPQAYFDALYARDADPWGFRSRRYEADKYDDTVAALGDRRFGRAVEIGCSIGELTARLGQVCDALLGVDIAEAALRSARARNFASPRIRFARMRLPETSPTGPFDLIVLSEVLYYFSAEDRRRVADWAKGELRPGGLALLVHWLGETPDYPFTGDQAVEGFIQEATPGLTIVRQFRRDLYRIDLLRPTGSCDAAGAPPTGSDPATP